MSLAEDTARMQGGASMELHKKFNEPLAVAVALEKDKDKDVQTPTPAAPASVPMTATTLAQQKAGQRSLAETIQAMKIKFTPIGKK